MTFGECLSTALQQDFGVSSLVGERVYPNAAPLPDDEEVPFQDSIVYRRMSRQSIGTLSRTEFVSEAWELRITSTSYARATSIMDACIAVLDGHSGSFPVAGGDGVLDAAITIDDAQDTGWSEELGAHMAVLVLTATY